ncbi:MAG: hypothetical protein L0Y66_26695 [Myxococcaceae bacterium]|nr:hypothetical protein [Myxococcaceae bacterium]MCI0669984.1 hypothetical protein [Myxococcaceae bacterium]
MSAQRCPELDELFDAVVAGSGDALEHALGCEACSAVLEEHRQMEKDLYRVVDPLPPPDFVQSVMTRVAEAPVPLRRELTAGFGILGGSAALAGLVLARDPQVLDRVGLAFARVLVDGQAFVPRLLSALVTVWDAAGFVGIAACSTLLFGSLFGLKRLSGEPTISEA